MIGGEQHSRAHNRTLNEIDLRLKIKHQHIVNMHAHNYIDDSCVVMMMDHCEMSMREAIENIKYDDTLLFRQLLDAVAYLSR